MIECVASLARMLSTTKCTLSTVRDVYAELKTLWQWVEEVSDGESHDKPRAAAAIVQCKGLHCATMMHLSNRGACTCSSSKFSLRASGLTREKCPSSDTPHPTLPAVTSQPHRRLAGGTLWPCKAEAVNTQVSTLCTTGCLQNVQNVHIYQTHFYI